QLVHLGALLPDHHAGPAGVNRHGDLPGPALDVDLGDGRVPQAGVEVLPHQLVFLEQRRHLLARVPAGHPGLDDAEPEAHWMCFLTHQAVSSVLLRTLISTWLVRLRIGVARPCAAAWNRRSGVPPFTIAWVTTNSSRSNRSFSRSAFCSALATALFSVLAICRAASRLLCLRMA